jgi:hypothetical protein
VTRCPQLFTNGESACEFVEIDAIKPAEASDAGSDESSPEGDPASFD